MVALFYIGVLSQPYLAPGKKTFSTFKNSQFSDQIECIGSFNFQDRTGQVSRFGLVSMAV